MKTCHENLGVSEVPISNAYGVIKKSLIDFIKMMFSVN